MNEINLIGIFTYFIHLILLLPLLSMELWIGFSIAVIWKFFSIHRQWNAVPRFFLVLTGPLILLYFRLEAPYFWHLPSLASMTLLISLFLLLDRAHKRQIMLVHFSFFALLLVFLYSPSPGYPLFLYFSLTFLIFISLLSHQIKNTKSLAVFSLGISLIKIAIPTSIFLLSAYFFFPDLIPKPSDTAITGLSYSIEPGKISKLALSDRIAFQAKFENFPKELSSNRFYWRVGVLEKSSGMTWKPATSENNKVWLPVHPKAALTYKIFPEERVGPRLPTLEQTQTIENVHGHVAILWNSDHMTFQNQGRIYELTSNLASSYPAHEPAPPDIGEIVTSPRVRVLADSLKGKPVSRQIQILLQLFKDFKYTLEPETLNAKDPLDDFLFEKRNGFCEHFSAAFATIMQLAGTPTRIIIGFEGGQRFSNDTFMIVRDSDAHAWTEVWRGDRWERVDPTSIVPGKSSRVYPAYWMLGYANSYITFWSRYVVDAVVAAVPDIDLLWLCIFLPSGILLIFTSVRWLRLRSRTTAWERELEGLLRVLRKAGYERGVSEPITDFLHRVAGDYPEYRTELGGLSNELNSFQYGQQSEQKKPEQLYHSIQILHIKLQNRRK